MTQKHQPHKSDRWHHRVRRHLKDHVIPHEGNNHVPHLLQHRVLLGYSLLFILLKVLVVLVPVALPASSVYSSAITPSNIVDLTNQSRLNAGLTSLDVDVKLTQAAQAKAQDIITNQYFAHTSPSGVTPWSWIIGSGYDYEYAGENLALYFTTAEDVTAGWLASPSHRANIMSERFTEIGIGVVQGEFDGYYTTVVVQMFGQPKAALPATAVAVATPEESVVPPSDAPPTEDPEPTPEPAPVSEPEVRGEQEASTVIVEPSTVSVVPQENAYEVEVEVSNAESVSVHLGSATVPLEEEEVGTWSGTIAYEPTLVDEGGEQLYIVATNEDHEQSVQPIAYVAPEAQVQDVYTFVDGNEKTYRFFGLFTVQNLDDGVKQIYLYSIVILSALLLMGVMVKMHTRRPTVFAHGLVVVALAILLTVV